MPFEPADILPLIPSAFSTVKALAGMVSPTAAASTDLAQEIVEFVIDAERRGLDQVAIIQGVNDLVVQLDKRLRFGG